MKANLTSKEPEILKLWEKININKRLQELSKEKNEKFFLLSGPPFANGHMHMGHALNRVLKDTVKRIQLMLGKNVVELHGWDCHGLPIEAKVEEDFQGKATGVVDIRKFRSKCKRYAEKWIAIQKKEIKRLGLIAEHSEFYSTMDKKSELGIMKTVLKCIEKNLIYRDVKPVFWSIKEQTAFAEAEIVYENHKSQAIYVAYPIKKSETLNGVSIVIWTTTPWTIPCSRAVCYNVGVRYVLVEFNGKKYCIAKNLVENIMASSSFIRDVSISELEDVICHHPLKTKVSYNLDIPLLKANHVTDDMGTGFVHTAPSHGLDDFYICKKNGIEAEDTVSKDGFYNDCIEVFAGKQIFETIPHVIELLSHNLIKHYEIEHSYPYSWRSNTPLIFRVTPQWFLSLKDLRSKAIESAKKVEWSGSGKQRIIEMIKKRPDWCLSRQRLWGIPISIVSNGERALYNEAFYTELIDNIKLNGMDFCFDIESVNKLIKKHFSEDGLTFVNDIIDVWFESGTVSDFAGKQILNESVADLYLEGSDQHRGWFQSSLIISEILQQKAPYKYVYTHGFVVDQKGRKMSKSSGNYISCEDFIDKNGVDILRLWVLSSDSQSDISISEEIISNVKVNYRKIRNVLKYLLGSLDGFTVEEKILFEDMPFIEKATLSKLSHFNSDIIDLYKKYDFMGAFKKIHEFCNDISSLYLDIKKDTLYCDKKDSIRRRSARTVMDIIANYLLRWISIILPFTSEEAWQKMPLKDLDSIHLANFLDNKWKNSYIDEKYNSLVKIKKEVNILFESKRGDLKSNLNACVVIEYNMNNIFLASIVSKEDLKDFFTSSNVRLVESRENKVSIEKATGDKCDRCWILSEVVKDKMCKRCFEAVKEISSTFV